ncbi:MAG: hypothetical protein HZA01_06045 [Nitrospinae bacterium]|nr:hypothetical protein [Nitrospinota bacterium]
MDDLKEMAKDEELKNASHKASSRWLRKIQWREISIEEYLDFLEEFQKLKGDLNPQEYPHPKMQGEKYLI